MHSNFPTIHWLWCQTIEYRIEYNALKDVEAKQVFKLPTCLNETGWTCCMTTFALFKCSTKLVLKKETALLSLLLIMNYFQLCKSGSETNCCQLYRGDTTPHCLLSYPFEEQGKMQLESW